MSKIKIFISYKNKHTIIKSNVLEPIQTGRDISDDVFEDMIGDNTGKNISHKNSEYNELSAQYWAWKNYDKIGNPDYIGFMHYRRHFIFNNKNYKANFLGVVNFPRISEDYRKEINLNDKDIKNFIRGYDLVCIKRMDLNQRAKILKSPKCNNPRDCYGYNRGLKIKDYDLMIDVLKKIKPEYSKSADIFTNSHFQFGYNSFIMKKELFFEYNNFIFPILEELEKNIDFSSYCSQGIRTLGYLGERLLSIFIVQKYSEGKIKIKETPMTFIQNTNEEEPLPMPMYNKKCVVFTSSDFYAPYTFVAISSLIKNYKPKEKLDIVILSKDFSDKNKNIFYKNFVKDEISLRFFDMNSYIFPKSIKVTDNISEETYYRIFVPRIFKNYDRVLFLDSDIVVNDDVSNLLNLKMQDEKLAMCKDSVMQCFLNDNMHHDYNYLKDALNLQNPFTYCNAGVMLVNIKKFWDYDVDNVVTLLAKRSYTYFDQDPINEYFSGKIKNIHAKWNFNPITLKDIIYKFIPSNYIEEFSEANNNPSIIHYNSSFKPWLYPEEVLADIWWQYARQTPFYEEILARLINFRITQQKNEFITPDITKLRQELANVHFPNINNRFGVGEYNAKLSFVMNHLLHFRLKKFGYALKKAFAFGERYAKYNDKYQKTKQLIKDAKKLKKSYYKV